jgi:hypothetical protein
MGDFIVATLNKLIELLASVISWLVSILPDSPFQLAMSSDSIQTAIANWNWFFPISEILVTMQAWVSCIAIYYVIVVPMRFAKLIGSGS